MTEQLVLDTGDTLTRSRCVPVSTETGEEGAPFWLDSPCGCVTCNQRHDGNEWLPRVVHPLVVLIGRGRCGLLFCPAHARAEVTAIRVRLAGEAASAEARLTLPSWEPTASGARGGSSC